MIKLPVHPKTVEELGVISHWLRAISLTHFHFFNMCSFINPTYLQLLFPPSPSGPVIRFRADIFWYPYGTVQALVEFAPRICARNVENFRCSGTSRSDLVELACSTGAIPDSFLCANQMLVGLQHTAQVFFKKSFLTFIICKRYPSVK